MVLRVKCKCGAGLKIPSTAADKVIKCPTCAKKFRVPAAKFQAQAESAAARKPTAPNPAPIKKPSAATAKPSAAAQSAIEPIPINLDDDLLNDMGGEIGFSDRDLLSAAEHQNNAPSIAAPLPLPAVPVGMPVEGPADLGYAQDPVRMKRSQVAAGVVGGPVRSFWADLGYAFIFPFATLGNALNTVFVIGLNVFASFSCFGLFVDLYMAAVYMNIVSDSASGSDDYKAATLEGGVWEAVIRPFLRFVATFAICMIPFWAYLGLVDQGLMPANMPLFVLWTGVGIFLWPMMMLLASLEMLNAISKPLQIVATIGNTILPYLAIWGLLLIAMVLMFMSVLGAQIMEELGLSAKGMGAGAFGFLGGRIVGEASSVLMMIIAMRLIGLYYLHFKHKFTFKLE